MKQNPEAGNSWRPRYPEQKDQKVQLADKGLELLMLEQQPVIFIKDEEPVDPACFWIDKEHVYLRINWSTWSPVSVTDTGSAETLCHAVYCKIALSVNALAVTQVIAPVYHISALPENVRPPAEESADDDDEYRKCLRTINLAVHAVSDDLQIYELVDLGNETASAAIASDSQMLVLDILPEDRCFVFTPANGEEKNRVMNEWPTDMVSLDFIEKLRRLKKNIAKQELETRLDIGLLANEMTIEILRDAADGEDISDLKLFTYANLKKELSELFSETVEIKEENLADRVRKIIALTFEVDPSEVGDDTTFLDDLHAKMLDLITLAAILKDIFGCDVPFVDDFDQFQTVRDVIEYLEKHQS